jgi:hypothetical protein
MSAIVPATAFAPLAPDWDLSKLDLNFSGIIAALASQNTYSNFLLDTGIANAYVTVLPAGITGSLAQGLQVQFLVGNANTGASTLVYAGLPAKNIVNVDGTALVASQLIAGAVAQVVYDGTKFILLSGSPIFVTSGTWTPAVGGSATYTAQVGSFLKLTVPSVGSVVSFNGTMTINAIGSGSTSIVTGLPFGSSTVNDICQVRLANAANTIVSAVGNIGGTSINVLSRAVAAVSDSAVAVFGNGTICVMSGMYRVA